ncbi:hypothetical protein BDZ94DRAFT_1257562 [Collybia nuda]|uniref:Mediator of RNA polymerase II transcription subunit 25 von Willebrand factor type A domain-containing protein n=1 Tax=Collybia nuda TaxID=64659 RepID=A0A9P6CKJ4_9AGAR|nr:hypothetical protein BDZ94DRAFT_1257562 [Collybia nuda]
MASDPTTHIPELLAVAFVVESSLSVFTEWQRILRDYVAPMLKRLSETNPGYKLHMGFVTYGTADTYPSPLLCKQYFAEFQVVTKDMKDSPEKLGVGTTISGGNRGMAALEGLVAAIELFDTLRSCTQPARPHINHIFHIAFSDPDASIRPQWNDTPLLDSVSWDDLPSELKKRNVHISSILLRQNIPRFPELHSAVAPSAPKMPWFTPRSPHSILLSGFPMSPQKAVKRPGEAHPNERTPDSKRQRLIAQSAIDSSPKVQPPAPNTPSMQPKPSPTLYPQTQAQPPVQPQTQPPQPATALPTQPLPVGPVHQPPPQPQPAAQYKNLVMGFRTIEEQVKNLQQSIQEALTAGNTTLAETLRQDWMNKKALHAKFKNAIALFNQKMQMQAQAQASNTNIASSSNTNTAPQNLTPNTNPNPNPTQDVLSSAPLPNPQSTSPNMGGPLHDQAFTQHMRERPLSNTNRIASSNVINAQMQKLLEDQQRRTGPLATHPGMNSHNSLGSSPVSLSGLNMGRPPPQPSENPGGMAPKTQGQGTVIWQGTLSWSGQGAMGKKEMGTYVVASTTSPPPHYVETWPTNLALVPVRRPVVSMPDLQAWMKQHKPLLCTFAAHPNNAQDRQTNDANYKTLVQLLSTKNMYAAAAWTRLSGDQGNNVLFFPINNLGLVGAFFPLTGIPDFPKSLAHPQPNSQPAMSLPPELIERMRSMTQEQRETVFTQLRKQQMQARMNAAAAGMNTNTNNPNGNVNAMGLIHGQHQDMGSTSGSVGGSPAMFSGSPALGTYGGMGMMNTMGMVPTSVLSGSLPRSVSGGTMFRNADVSHEMMQSFIQRNQGGNGMGSSMGNGMGGPV